MNRNVFMLCFIFTAITSQLAMSQMPTGGTAGAQPVGTPTSIRQPSPRPISPGGSRDIDLVEKVLNARKEYQTTLEALRAHYINVGEIEKAKWAEEELLNYHRISK